MSAAALDLNAVSRPAVNPWYVATAVVVPTFMEILDTTIATASLRYIAGGLSATMNDSDWVMTSYLAANATILPITGWISAHLGRRNYFLLSIAVFTIASVLCGLAKDPDDRFPEAESLEEALGNCSCADGRDAKRAASWWSDVRSRGPADH